MKGDYHSTIVSVKYNSTSRMYEPLLSDSVDDLCVRALALPTLMLRSCLS